MLKTTCFTFSLSYLFHFGSTKLPLQFDQFVATVLTYWRSFDTIEPWHMEKIELNWMIILKLLQTQKARDKEKCKVIVYVCVCMKVCKCVTMSCNLILISWRKKIIAQNDVHAWLFTTKCGDTVGAANIVCV